jgi:hypothetical protein
LPHSFRFAFANYFPSDIDQTSTHATPLSQLNRFLVNPNATHEAHVLTMEDDEEIEEILGNFP